MASDKHLELSGFIKSVHQDLRILSKKMGPEKAWEIHCQQQDKLKKYAEAMRDLAVIYWDKNNENSDSKCRIEWVVTHSELYFFKGDRENEIRKEIDLVHKHSLQLTDRVQEALKEVKCGCTLDLLDVGSCCNMFEKYPSFNVTAIDLCPSDKSVLKCDFLKCSVGSETIVTSDRQITGFSICSYDVVVFSLLLEYLPDSRQRFECCQKAYHVLRPGGVLFILTPDSKHATANSGLMKRWRICLSSLGFTRVYYEKLRHLHCMMFKKAFHKELPLKWFQIKNLKCEEAESMLNIPQDQNMIADVEVATHQRPSEFAPKSEADLFSMLPMDDVS